MRVHSSHGTARAKRRWQGSRVNLAYRWVSQHTPSCKTLLGWGMLSSATMRARFARAGSPKGKGWAFSMPCAGWVFPLAGVRFVPRTGVREVPRRHRLPRKRYRKSPFCGGACEGKSLAEAGRWLETGTPGTSCTFGTPPFAAMTCIGRLCIQRGSGEIRVV